MTSVDILKTQLESARKSILFMETQHANTLKGLHAEIQQLQKKCSELLFDVAMKDEATQADEENLQKMKILENEVDELTKEKISLVQQVELRDKHLVKMEEHITAQEKSFTKEIQAHMHTISSLTIELDSRANAVGILSVKLNQARSKLHKLIAQESNAGVICSPTPPSKPKTSENRRLHRSSKSGEMRPISSSSCRTERCRFSLSPHNTALVKQSRPSSASLIKAAKSMEFMDHTGPSQQQLRSSSSPQIVKRPFYSDVSQSGGNAAITPKPLCILPPIDSKAKDPNGNSAIEGRNSQSWVLEGCVGQRSQKTVPPAFERGCGQSSQIAVRHLGAGITSEREIENM
ncbi:uncharacterized protein LOC143448342 [Clavelina lepadiformis]|uniref:CCDC92/74 N-terminal domain-containing protein n=1 Tax=Clavelina lepadiformis TaxID=159417 RepID=A0ABP0H1T9_CLALP